MGLVKVKRIRTGVVKFIHQLGQDGKPYAEDVTIESVVPGRIGYFEEQDGAVGVLNFSFNPYKESEVSKDIKFPEE